MVKTPEMARSLPPVLGARPGTRDIAGVVDPDRRRLHANPVALDPGRDLSNWGELSWFDRATGTGCA
jgi:hypothetical protein